MSEFEDWSKEQFGVVVDHMEGPFNAGMTRAAEIVRKLDDDAVTMRRREGIDAQEIYDAILRARDATEPAPAPSANPAKPSSGQ